MQKKIIIILTGAAILAAAAFTVFAWKPWEGLSSNSDPGTLGANGSNRGNHPRNDLVVADGEWIYYVNKGNDKIGDGNIYRIHIDGTQNELIVDGVGDAGGIGRYLNIWNGWLYYRDFDNRCISRVRLDGTKSENLPANYSSISIVDGYIYGFSLDDSIFSLYSMNLDGSNSQLVIDEDVDAYGVSNGWVYYSNFRGSELVPRGYENGIYRVRNDGSGKEKLTDDHTMIMMVVEDWIYYLSELDDSKLYRIKTDGSERTKLFDENTSSTIVTEEWIYYTVMRGESSGIYKMRLDGSEQTKLIEVTGANQIDYADGWLFFLIREEGDDNTVFDDELYRVRIDGTGYEKMTF